MGCKVHMLCVQARCSLSKGIGLPCRFILVAVQ